MRNPSSTSTPCCSKVGIKRGPWTPEEDEVLSNYIKKDGEGRWRTLPKRAGLQRCGKSCRLRWMNYLRPCVKRGHIAPDEEDLILRLHRLLGNRWSLIAGRIPGRTDNEIKNYWNTHLSKKLIAQGIDPRTHKPLNPSPPNITSPLHNNDPPSKHNPNNSQELEQTSSTGKGNIGNTITHSDPDHLYQCNNQRTSDDPVGVAVDDIWGDGRYTNMCNEDTFSSFLDSLINESAALVTIHQQPPPPLPQLPRVTSLSAHNFDHGSIWEAELKRSTMDTLADLQNGFNNHHP